MRKLWVILAFIVIAALGFRLGYDLGFERGKSLGPNTVVLEFGKEKSAE